MRWNKFVKIALKVLRNPCSEKCKIQDGRQNLVNNPGTFGFEVLIFSGTTLNAVLKRILKVTRNLCSGKSRLSRSGIKHAKYLIVAIDKIFSKHFLFCFNDTKYANIEDFSLKTYLEFLKSI